MKDERMNEILQRLKRVVDSDISSTYPDFKYGQIKPLSERERQDYTLYISAQIATALNTIAERIDREREQEDV